MAFRSSQLTRRSSGLRGESIVFPDALSARSRLTRRWASQVASGCVSKGASQIRASFAP
jgi:hypothetical protein